MSFLSDLVDILLGDGNPITTKGDSYSGAHKQVFDVQGEEVEVEYFDDQPQQMRWRQWHTNKNGDVL